MTIHQNKNSSEEAANSSNATNHTAQTPDDHTEQRVILLPTKAHHSKTFWIGVLAKYFNIWVPTSPVHLKEDGSPYNFDFYSESHSKLVKIFSPDEEETIRLYLDLPYAKHILFILDLDMSAPDYECGYCGECGGCNHLDELAQEMGAHLCHRRDTEINYIMGEDDDGEWGEVKPYRY